MNFGQILAQPADFDQDGDVDTDDIDLLSANFGNAMYDLNGDGTADAGDVDYMLDTILFTVRGDTNLDGKVDLIDLATFGENYGATSAGWAQGDTDGNGTVDLLDLARFGESYGYDNSGALAITPMAGTSIVRTAEDVTVIHISGAALMAEGPMISLTATPTGAELLGPVAMPTQSGGDEASEALATSVFTARVSGTSLDTATTPWRSVVEGESVLEASFVMPTGFLAGEDDDDEGADVLLDMDLL